MATSSPFTAKFLEISAAAFSRTFFPRPFCVWAFSWRLGLNSLWARADRGKSYYSGEGAGRNLSFLSFFLWGAQCYGMLNRSGGNKTAVSILLGAIWLGS